MLIFTIYHSINKGIAMHIRNQYIGIIRPSSIVSMKKEGGYSTAALTRQPDVKYFLQAISMAKCEEQPGTKLVVDESGRLAREEQ